MSWSRSLLRTSAFAAVVAGATTAQVEFVYSDISSTGGNYTDAIVLWGPNTQFPLVSESTVRGTTGSARKFQVVADYYTTWLFWLNVSPTDAIYRGADFNINGVIDASEITEVFAFDAVSEGQIDELGGKWWGSCGSPTANDRGLWLFQDMNGDVDWKDSGEAKHVISGSDNTIGTATISTDDIRACAFLSNGDCIWYEDDARVWVRTTQAGASSYFLVYTAPTVVSGAAPATNPDFGAALPAFSDRFDRVAVDRVTDTVYIAVNFSASAPYVLRGKDMNGDGDINDGGEVGVYMDGLVTGIRWIDDVDWRNGSLYLSHEIDPANDPGSEFIELTDNNGDGDAMDSGEITVLGRTASTDDPTVIGITVVPSGLFGPSCVNAALDRDSEFSVAGGTVTYALKDIPVSMRGGAHVGFGLLSLAGDAPIRLANGCFLGFTPDGLSPVLVLSTGVITSAAAPLSPPIFHPPGLPAGIDIYSVGVIADTVNFSFDGMTGTGVSRIQ